MRKDEKFREEEDLGLSEWGEKKQDEDIGGKAGRGNPRFPASPRGPHPPVVISVVPQIYTSRDFSEPSAKPPIPFSFLPVRLSPETPRFLPPAEPLLAETFSCNK